MIATMDVSINRALIELAQTEPAAGDWAWNWPAKNWRQFFGLAEAHGVLGIVLDNLQRQMRHDPTAFGEHVPGLDLARRVWRAQVAKTLRIRHWSARLQTLIAAAGIPCAILKGIDFADQLYPQPALRPTRDVDLLVPDECWSAAERILAGAGYGKLPLRNARKHANCGNTSWTLGAGEAILLELHWSLVFRENLRRQMAVTMNDLDWRPTARAGVLEPTAATRLLLTALHGIGHQFDRLLLLCDLREACRRMVHEPDLQSLQPLLARTGTRRIVELALVVLARNLPDPSVLSLMEQIPPRISASAAARCISRGVILKPRGFPYLRRLMLRSWLKYAA
ncbi:MAG: nucleotidyltransferase family protein [Pirellulaceae bacterium]|nr:nucleotidyltransferase family protein [Pirellulaceae bacterium]